MPFFRIVVPPLPAVAEEEEESSPYIRARIDISRMIAICKRQLHSDHKVRMQSFRIRH